MIKQNDGVTYAEEPVNCEQEKSTATTCFVPVEVLMVPPFNLRLGDKVYVKVSAINALGESSYSVANRGASVVVPPGAPTGLVEDPTQRSGTTLGLQWVAPAKEGGSEVTEYRVMYSEADGDFVELEAGIVNPSYVATGLTSGTNYKFKVEAKNIAGFGEASEAIALLAAGVPATPDAPTVTFNRSDDIIEINWSTPDNGGSAISGYKVMISHSDGVTFSQDLANCDMQA